VELHGLAVVTRTQHEVQVARLEAECDPPGAAFNTPSSSPTVQSPSSAHSFNASCQGIAQMCATSASNPPADAKCSAQ
jgi:hypothetical protein